MLCPKCGHNSVKYFERFDLRNKRTDFRARCLAKGCTWKGELKCKTCNMPKYILSRGNCGSCAGSISRKKRKEAKWQNVKEIEDEHARRNQD